MAQTTSPQASRHADQSRYPAAVYPSEAALSFLKDTKGATTWSVRDLADVLKISRRDAEQVIALQRLTASDIFRIE
jgi:hypothetical protein